MICPKCGLEQADATDCVGCGIIIERYLARQQSPATTPAPNRRNRRAERYRLLEKEREQRRFFETMAVMLDAGLTAEAAAGRFLEEPGAVRNLGPFQRVHQAVKSGGPLADGISQSPDYFPPHHVALVNAGETAGHPAHMFRELQTVIDTKIRTTENVLKEIRKPALTAIASFLILPLPTLVGDGIVAYLASSLLPLGLLVVAVFIARGWWRAQYRDPQSAIRLDEKLFGLGLVSHFTVNRFVQVFRLLYAAGVPTADAFTRAAQATGNHFLEKVLASHAPYLAEGRTVTDVMRDTGAFPPELLTVVATGEAAGSMDEALARYHATSSEAFDNRLSRTTSIASAVVGVLLMLYVGARIVFGFIDAMPDVNLPQ